ncbi:type 4a pilus biogenesis protein PilO, partial [bacterium]|nr:type 4a pilus biogenesis protein PilO [bacterium]
THLHSPGKGEEVMPLVDLSKIPKQQRIILAVLVGIILIVLVNNRLFKPIVSKRKDLRIKYQNLETELMRKEFELQEVQVKTEKERIAQLEEKYRHTQKKLEYLKGRLPKEKQIPALLSQIASQARLEYNLIKMLPEESRLVYKEIPIQIQVKGRYQDLGEYLKRLEESTRLIKIKSLSIKTDPKTLPKLDVTLEIATFVVK